MENITEFIQAIREMERLKILTDEYKRTHDVIAEIKEEYPIGTKLKQFDELSRNLEVTGYMYGINPEDCAFWVKSDFVKSGTVLMKRVEKLKD